MRKKLSGEKIALLGFLVERICSLLELRNQFEVALRAGKTEKLEGILSEHEKSLMQRLLFYSQLKEETLICT